MTKAGQVLGHAAKENNKTVTKWFAVSGFNNIFKFLF
jgi:hypothetical protein